MRVLIFGATGRTGRELVRQALERGHEVTAFARNPSALPIRHERLQVVQGDILDKASIERAVAGQDAVISALGARTLRRSTVLSEGTKNILKAMRKHGVNRFVCMSSLGVGDSRGQLGPLYDFFLIPLLLRNVFADKQI